MCDADIKCYLYIKKVKCDKPAIGTSGIGGSGTTGSGGQNNPPLDDPNTPEDEATFAYDFKINDTGTDNQRRQIATGVVDPSWSIIETKDTGPGTDIYIKAQDDWRITSSKDYAAGDEIVAQTIFLDPGFAGKTIKILAPTVETTPVWKDIKWSLNDEQIYWETEEDIYNNITLTSTVTIKGSNQLKIIFKNMSNQRAKHDLIVYYSLRR